MRAKILVVGLVQAVLLAACTDSQKRTEGSAASTDTFLSKAANPAPMDAARDRGVSPEETSAGVQGTKQWFGTATFDPASRLIVRTGQASIEVDSLNPSMAELRRIVQGVGGFVADASVQSGRNQVRRCPGRERRVCRSDRSRRERSPAGGPARGAPAYSYRQASRRTHRGARACEDT